MSSEERRQLKVTTTIPEAMRTELDDLVAATGIGLADLMRQGLIRIINELRTQGRVSMEVLTPIPEPATV